MKKAPSRTSRAGRNSKRTKLPEQLRPLFWDYPFGRLRWECDAELATDRVLAYGGFREWQWLRRWLGDEELADWICARRGRGLSPRQLRYWELVLGISRKDVSEWLRDPGRQVWDRRTG